MPSRPPHIVSLDALQGLRAVSPEQPLRAIMSHCLNRRPCIYDGTALGEDDFFAGLLALPTFRPAFFCPEETMYGTPRALSDIHGGNGFDVLDGKARVLADDGSDWTENMIEAGRRMLAVAKAHRAELAILLDMSAACGVQVISAGPRGVPDRAWQIGPGVAAATLIRAGIPVISQRDDRSLQLLRSKLEAGYLPEAGAQDHHEREWYRGYFKSEE